MRVYTSKQVILVIMIGLVFIANGLALSVIPINPKPGTYDVIIIQLLNLTLGVVLLLFGLKMWFSKIEFINDWEK